MGTASPINVLKKSSFTNNANNTRMEGEDVTEIRGNKIAVTTAVTNSTVGGCRTASRELLGYRTNQIISAGHNRKRKHGGALDFLHTHM